MSKIHFYEIILIAPAIIYSLRIVLIEIAKEVSVSDYTRMQMIVREFIAFITRSSPNQNTLNEELSSILQMLSIMISAGESPVTSLKYIAERSEGLLPELISKELGNLHSEGNLVKTLNYLAVATGSKQVRRLGNSIQVAIDRGSPLRQVIQNQVISLNKEIHTQLLKKSGRSEITLLIPVVFLILPVSILFAIWPSIYNLNLGGI